MVIMNNTIKNTLGQAIANCSNQVKLEDMIKLEAFETRNISEELAQKREEVKNLEGLIKECEEAKAATEANEKAKKEAEAKFINSLTNSEREALAYLEGLQVR